MNENHDWYAKQYKHYQVEDQKGIDDFYIPSGNGRPQAVYIEFWGIENDPKYTERKKRKLKYTIVNAFH